MTNSRSSFIMGIRAGILVLSLGLCSGHAQDSSYPDEQDNPGAYAYVQGDYTGAANIWLVEAYEGSAEAQFNLGVLYLEGKGVPQNRDSAIFWFNEASQSGYVEAQYNLGHLLVENRNDEKSVRRGVQWWAKAANQGYPIAQFNYGLAFFHGFGVARDLAACKYWMEKSAQGGENVARNFLLDHAAMFVDVNSVPIDSEQSADEQTVSITEQSGSESTPVQQTENIQRSDTQAEAETTEYYLVTESSIKIFSKHNAESPVIVELDNGTLLRLISRQDNWMHVQIPGGVPTWILQESKPKPGSYLQIDQSGLLVYATEALETESVMGKIDSRTKLLVLESRENQVRVLAPEYIGGWVEERSLVRVHAPEHETADLWQEQRINKKNIVLLSVIEPESANQQALLTEQSDVVSEEILEEEKLAGTTVEQTSKSFIEPITSELMVDEFVALFESTSGDLVQADAGDNDGESENLIVSKVEQDEKFEVLEIDPSFVSTINESTVNVQKSDPVESEPEISAEPPSKAVEKSEEGDANDIRFVDEMLFQFEHEPTGYLNDNDWLFGHPDSRVTYQLFSARDEDDALEFFDRLDEKGQLFSYSVSGVKWFSILYGSYVNSSEAESHRILLPQWAQSGVIRSFGSLQETRCDSVESLDELESQGLEKYCGI